MNPKKVNLTLLAQRIADGLEEHKIGHEDQVAAIAMAFIACCNKMGFTRANAIDIIVSTYDAYDSFNTES